MAHGYKVFVGENCDESSGFGEEDTVTGVLETVLTDWFFGPQGATLVIADAASASAADNLTLVQHHVLAVQDATCPTVTDNVGLGVALAIQSAVSTTDAEQPNLIQHHVLVVQDAVSPTAAEAIALLQRHILAIANAQSTTQSENVGFVQHHVLTVTDMVSVSFLDEPTLTQHHILDIAPATTVGFAENVTLIVPCFLEIQNVVSATVAEEPVLAYQYAVFKTLKSRTGDVIPGAIVYLFRTSDGALMDTGHSGADGKFRLVTEDNYTHHFVVTFCGYSPRLGGVTVDTLVGV